jgi:hypothetical protein
MWGQPALVCPADRKRCVQLSLEWAFSFEQISLVLKKCPTMQISYELTVDDFTQAYAVHRNGRVVTRWVRRGFILLTVLLVLVGILMLAFRATPGSAATGRNLLFLAGLWSACIWLWPWWFMRRQFLKQPGAHGPRTVTLDEAGVRWKWSGGASEIDWKNYIRYVEGKNLILFYTSPAAFGILPKRSLSHEQLNDLRGMLKQFIPIR